MEAHVEPTRMNRIGSRRPDRRTQGSVPCARYGGAHQEDRFTNELDGEGAGRAGPSTSTTYTRKKVRFVEVCRTKTEGSGSLRQRQATR
ncbi:hypothetical protein BRADI_2g06365v3 [Brachypodium distachyon]|uniref:Uncharacterized protein n=1 Tax=Brachypodium distachyon TaxID=15368 RepID=A0A2K2D781_BRADI|nr:hypothetical protein BRADI_2g06365v3 [Brachypodium distachyon]